MVKTYSKNKDGNLMLSPHFAVREFACKDGTDTVLISASLIDKLEQIYDYLNCSKIIVNSGYRTPAHDKAVGGNGKGQHTLGKAADIQCYDKDGKLIDAKYVCCAAETLGCNGIGYISSKAVHIDTRSGKWWGDETTGNDNINSFYDYFGVDKPKASEPNIYIVKKGDTLTAIASKYNCTVLDLSLLNNITNANLIYAGQVIKLPNKASTNSNPYLEPARNISRGAKGEDVKWVQYALQSKGYDVGKAGVDGICGNDTLAAIKRFQGDTGLVVDGIVGKLTKAKLTSTK